MIVQVTQMHKTRYVHKFAQIIADFVWFYTMYFSSVLKDNSFDIR